MRSDAYFPEWKPALSHPWKQNFSEATFEEQAFKNGAIFVMLAFQKPLRVAQSSEQVSFTSEIVGLIRAEDSWYLYEKSQSTLYQKSWIFSGYSGFLPEGMLTGCLGISS